MSQCHPCAMAVVGTVGVQVSATETAMRQVKGGLRTRGDMAGGRKGPRDDMTRCAGYPKFFSRSEPKPLDSDKCASKPASILHVSVSALQVRSHHVARLTILAFDGATEREYTYRECARPADTTSPDSESSCVFSLRQPPHPQ